MWSKSTRITIMLVIDIVFFLIELIVGLLVGSLALMADAFHMLNDIISLLVGLWAVKAALRSSSDKYSFGWLRAEILGAFFNAVFLIALCLSIVLEAITRLIDPPEISNPKLILIVGCMGLASNLAGFVVLGGHGHSHGEEDGHGAEHEHSHSNEQRDAEEGHGHSHHVSNGHAHESGVESGDIADVGPVSRALQTPESSRHIRFNSSEDTAATSYSSERSPGKSNKSARRYRRRTNSVRNGRLGNIEDLSIHPASFRQEIIAASKPQLDGIQSEEESGAEGDVAVEELPSETTPLIVDGKSPTVGHHDHNHGNGKHRHDSWHATHNHNKPKKASKSTGHNHGDMGMRAMVLHVMGDALGNLGVIVSALVIWLTTWSGRYYADPAVSLFITLIILKTTVPLTTATAKILLQATPDHLDVKDIKEDIQDIPGVVDCHHVHIWQLSDSQIVASMHIQVAFPISEAGGSERYMELAKAVRKCLHAYGIHSATIQPEFCLDKAHDHGDNPSLGLDGSEQLKTPEDDCLLGCVEDCTGKGCCSPPSSTTEAAHDHGAHDHEEYDGHGHGHGNGHSH